MTELDRTSEAYVRGYKDGSSTFLNHLESIVNEHIAEHVDDPDETGPTWNGLLGYFRDMRGRMGEHWT